MATPEAEDTDKQIRTLAGWAVKYRSGVKHMVEQGFDPDELDASIAEAEEAYQAEQQARRKRQVQRKNVEKF